MVNTLTIIVNSLVREWFLRLSWNFEANSSTRWMLHLAAHMELQSLRDSLFFLDEMILIKDEGLFGTDEVILVCCGLWYLNLVLLSTKICIITTEVSGVNLQLLERLKLDIIHTSQIRIMYIMYFALGDWNFGLEIGCTASQSMGIV